MKVEPRDTILMIAAALDHLGLKSTILKAGIIAVVTTEGGYTPRSEMSYKNTPNDHLRNIFGHRLAHLDEPALLTLKNNDVLFFDVVYGGVNGNTAVGDGWKYRGRGFNQITYRSNYQQASIDCGVDLITNPDRLNEPELAALGLAGFFAKGLGNAQKAGQIGHKYPGVDYQDVRSLSVATLIALQQNAGWGTDISRGWLANEHLHQLDASNSIFETLKTNLI